MHNVLSGRVMQVSARLVRPELEVIMLETTNQSATQKAAANRGNSGRSRSNGYLQILLC